MTPVRYSLAQRWFAFRRGIPWALLFVGCSLSATAGWYVSDTAESRLHARFVADAQKTTNEIQVRLSSSVDVVQATAALITADSEINWVEFRAFVTALHLPSRYPGLTGIGFARVVPDQDRARFLKLAALDGARLGIRPDGRRPVYYPVEVFEPHADAPAGAVGFDLASDPVAYGAIEQARDSGQPVISGSVSATRPWDAGDERTVLVLVPIYRRSSAVDTIEQRRGALIGVVLSPLAIGQLLRGIEATSPSFQFALYEGDRQSPDALRYASGTEPGSSGYRSIEPIVIGAEPWLVIVKRAVDQGEVEHMAAVTFGSGLLLTLLLFGLTRAQVRAWVITSRHHTDLRRLALHDPLTGLPNRALLEEQLPQAIAAAERHQNRLAVLFLDVDRFKEINDAWGHAAGDDLLRSVASRLLACVRKSDTVSRHGGDEFVLLLTDISRTAQVVDLAQELIKAVGVPHRWGSHLIDISVSAGVSVYPDDGQQPMALLQAADAAMYLAKERGRNMCQFFTPEMNARAAARQRTERGLRRALADEQLELHYQPTIALDTGRITGLEALVRWRDPDRGLVAPADFVPAAEESGLIVAVGQWALRQACLQARAWSEMGLPVTVAVNVSAVELRAQNFLEHARQVLDETGLDPHHLELELTESVLMQRAASTVGVLQGLRDLGVAIAIDDFGTGYSSVTYLRQLPIDVLKVDQSFVREIPGGAAPIVSAMISMGKSLGHRVIAEGVETAEQHAFLQAHQCGEGQGFYFAHPMTPAEVTEALIAGELGVYLRM